MKARLGAPKAITATAHKLARIFYKIWNESQDFDPTLFEQLKQKARTRTETYVRKKAYDLGFELILNPSAIASEGVLGLKS
ncbi:MAG: hypothetical protein GKR87_07795 [Kiritimatiellae bacterium]|nr:hypothetical protein [Kiritimatiellia bacterium]